MSLEQILVGILALLVGAAFCFSGIKWFMVLLPIWGFLVGFTFGANAIFYIAGADHGFFADALAIVSGLVVGVLLPSCRTCTTTSRSSCWVARSGTRWASA